MRRGMFCYMKLQYGTEDGNIWLKLKRPIASKLVILIKKEVFNYFFNFKPISMVKIKGTAKNHTNRHDIKGIFSAFCTEECTQVLHQLMIMG